MGEIKQAYITELEQRLSDGQVELRKLEARLDKANLEASHDLYLEMENLRKQRDETKEKLQVLREVDHENWQHMKDELDKAWHHMSELLHKIGKGLKREWDSND